jgi:hypothetical protein
VCPTGEKPAVFKFGALADESHFGIGWLITAGPIPANLSREGECHYSKRHDNNWTGLPLTKLGALGVNPQRIKARN